MNQIDFIASCVELLGIESSPIRAMDNCIVLPDLQSKDPTELPLEIEEAGRKLVMRREP